MIKKLKILRIVNNIKILKASNKIKMMPILVILTILNQHMIALPLLKITLMFHSRVYKEVNQWLG